VTDEVKAARVDAVTHVRHGLDFKTLGAIHAAPSWLWQALAAAAVAGQWTHKKTVEAVKPLQDAPDYGPAGAMRTAATNTSANSSIIRPR
jgi:hypothetical protein